ncbi:acetylcholine receptor subunit alpha-like [Mercenaria mercenaria]|uniref:acetylcholine receptor subunit alpha-like n=1 Tax=Mercenaria mercenaria TaxID=6596 RepID=UPI001E1D4E6B|nr:acetylcholine receptor subunit alpha-like [Mercenaria mercenaria]
MRIEKDIKVSVVFPLVFSCLYVGQNSCTSINDTNVLLRDVFERYNKNVRPVENQNDPVHVNVTLLLVSIRELDEVRGILSVMGSFAIIWHAANIRWNPKDYGGIEELTVSYTDVWVPELILVNPAEETDTLGKKWQKVNFKHTGFASWYPTDLLKSTCALDVYSYPFDTQECVLWFTVLGYSFDKVKINSPNDEMDLRFYIESSAWKISKSKASAFYGGLQIHFHINLQRKPGFVIVNIVLPLTFLSLLNAFVFVLSAESGERISYCITVLLSIAVFMTIVSDTLPKSSEPVPLISYKLMTDMVISSLITLVTILNLTLYNKKNTEVVPNWLQSMYLFLSCKRLKSRVHLNWDHAKDMENAENQTEKTKTENKSLNRNRSKRRQSGVPNARKPSITVVDLDEVRNESIKGQIARMVSEMEEENDAYIQVSWKNISSMVDGIAFVTFTLLSICSLIVFFVITLN